MLGKNHLLVALALSGVNLFFFYDKKIIGLQETVIYLAGISLGVLLPDVDAGDAKIFHGTGLRRTTLLNPLFVIAGYLTKLLVYFPTRLFWRGEHRGIMHSLLGAVLTALFWFTLVFLVQPVIAGTLATAILVGYVIHLAQDSFTRSGVAWLAPFSSKRICGQAATGNTSESILVLGFFVLAAMVYFTGRIVSDAALLPVLTVGLVVAYFVFSSFFLRFARLIPGFS